MKHPNALRRPGLDCPCTRFDKGSTHSKTNNEVSISSRIEGRWQRQETKQTSSLVWWCGVQFGQLSPIRLQQQTATSPYGGDE